MNKATAVVLAAGSLALVAGAVGWWWFTGASSDSGPRLVPDDPSVVQAGKVIYAAHCASCHGKELEGQSQWRQRHADGRLPAPPHDESGHTWHHDDAMLIRLTRFGPQAVAGSDYKSDMPAYDGVLSERDIVAVLSYIKSTWPKQVREHHDRVNANAWRAAGQ